MNALMTGMLPFGDLMMWVGISLTGILGVIAMMAPRWMRKRDTPMPRR